MEGRIFLAIMFTVAFSGGLIAWGLLADDNPAVRKRSAFGLLGLLAALPTRTFRIVTIVLGVASIPLWVAAAFVR